MDTPHVRKMGEAKHGWAGQNLSTKSVRVSTVDERTCKHAITRSMGMQPQL